MLHTIAPAQPGGATDRFARKIVGILKVVDGALAAVEHQTVGWLTWSTLAVIGLSRY